MRVMVIGLRGFPGVQGGVEKHAEELYPLLKNLGCEVEVLVRSPQVERGLDSWKGVRLRRLWSPGERIKGVEALVHTFLGTVYASVKRPDLLHIHAIGPALMTPLAKVLGLRVVFTHHGEDYGREKWGVLARWLLRMGERLGARFSDECIAISVGIRDLLREKYEREAVLIPNGVRPPDLVTEDSVLSTHGLEKDRYILMVSRFVPEKRQVDLIEAFSLSKLSGWKLVLVGGLEPEDEYIRRVRAKAKDKAAVVLTGFQAGSSLHALYTNAGMFVLPSSHEGLPIVLLEAMSYGLPVIASDIAPNLELGLPQEHYFPVGDVSALADRLGELAAREFNEAWRNRIRMRIKESYAWERIAEQTFSVYCCAVRHTNDSSS
jgi:glycosyltransferase involved in cell wall biosynthesis